MTLDPSTPPEPPQPPSAPTLATPQRRTLDHAPSERYRSGKSGGGEVPPGGAAIAADPEAPPGGAAPELQAGVVAIVGAALLVLVGGVLAFTTGLLFVSGVTAAAVGLFLAGASRSRAWVRNVAVGTSIVVVIVGAVGAWLVGLAEGGNIGLFDFLWATTGLLVPAELVIAAVAAAWGAGAGPIRG